MWNFKRQMYKSLNLASIGCNAITQSGGMGVTEYVIELDKPLGGIVVMDFNAQGVPDKIEILHNGIKKATSGMTVANGGPFDNIYGSPTIPDTSQANATDQFIGTGKGTVPTRDAIFLSETGITDVVRTNQQLVWWVYTAADYNTANTVIIRVTGIQGTAWNLKRLCTNQDPSGVDPPSSITITSITGYVEQCGPGYDTRIATSNLVLSSHVTVDTHFIIRSNYSLNGSCGPITDGSVDTYIYIPAGQSIGDSVGCGGAPSFSSEIDAAICTTFVVGHDNTIDNIII